MGGASSPARHVPAFCSKDGVAGRNCPQERIYTSSAAVQKWVYFLCWVGGMAESCGVIGSFGRGSALYGKRLRVLRGLGAKECVEGVGFEEKKKASRGEMLGRWKGSLQGARQRGQGEAKNRFKEQSHPTTGRAEIYEGLAGLSTRTPLDAARQKTEQGAKKTRRKTNTRGEAQKTKCLGNSSQCGRAVKKKSEEREAPDRGGGAPKRRGAKREASTIEMKKPERERGRRRPKYRPAAATELQGHGWKVGYVIKERGETPGEVSQIKGGSSIADPRE